ncbi:MFS transporter [Zoogloea ramigera]|uniref:MFS transporter n=1 Tax=Zoogloea ramigera TaxID=350 RepID=A0A4Y4CUH9_ZOORA|nr:MFS transporter [Zoogloea ramigera]GEC96571.1 MFS transporter [Zoogloea ramigera]
MNKIETLPGLRPGVARREVWAWAMYDFANSGYTTVVITAIFNAYFVAVIAGGAAWGTFAWTAALAVSYAAILLTAPFVGAWADTHGAKKRLLALTTAGCVLGTAGLALAGPGAIGVAIGFLVLSNYCFGTGENLIAAFLPELADDDSLGKVSGWGWSLGYLGGLTSLGACLAYIAWAEPQGHAAADYVPVTMLITALLFAVASVPTFLLLRERKTARATAPIPVWARVAGTLRQLRGSGPYRDMRRFMVCVVFYQAGIQAVIALAAIYAVEAMGFTTRETIGLIFVVNITAALGAFGFGYWQDRIGHRRAIAFTLAGWIVMILLAWAATRPPLFWLAANIAGLCLGASQSASRALVGYLAPPDRHGEFFGLWGLAVKLSSILGPLTYGAVTWLSGGDHRLAILITGSYFVVGLVILAGVDAERGHRSAQA